MMIPVLSKVAKQFLVKKASSVNDYRLPEAAETKRWLAFEHGVEQFCKRASFDALDTKAMFQLVNQMLEAGSMSKQAWGFASFLDKDNTDQNGGFTNSHNALDSLSHTGPVTAATPANAANDPTNAQSVEQNLRNNDASTPAGRAWSQLTLQGSGLPKAVGKTGDEPARIYGSTNAYSPDGRLQAQQVEQDKNLSRGYWGVGNSAMKALGINSNYYKAQEQAALATRQKDRMIREGPAKTTDLLVPSTNDPDFEQKNKEYQAALTAPKATQYDASNPLDPNGRAAFNESVIRRTKGQGIKPEAAAAIEAAEGGRTGDFADWSNERRQQAKGPSPIPGSTFGTSGTPGQVSAAPKSTGTTDTTSTTSPAPAATTAAPAAQAPAAPKSTGLPPRNSGESSSSYVHRISTQIPGLSTKKSSYTSPTPAIQQTPGIQPPRPPGWTPPKPTASAAALPQPQPSLQSTTRFNSPTPAIKIQPGVQPPRPPQGF